MIEYGREINNDNRNYKKLLERVAFIFVILFWIAVYLLISTLEFHGLI